MSNAPEHTKRTAIVAVAAFVGANLLFYLLSGSYFESHRVIAPGVGSMPAFSPEQVNHVRVSFAVFAAVVAGAGLFAGIQARAIGHAIPVLLGVVYLVAAVAAIDRGVPSALPATLIVAGGLMPVLAWYSYRDRSRAAWAFLVALCGVFAVVEFFGAPKVRTALDIGLWTTMILPGLNAVAVAALVSLRDEYLDRAIVTA